MAGSTAWAYKFQLSHIHLGRTARTPICVESTNQHFVYAEITIEYDTTSLNFDGFDFCYEPRHLQFTG